MKEASRRALSGDEIRAIRLLSVDGLKIHVYFFVFVYLVGRFALAYNFPLSVSKIRQSITQAQEPFQIIFTIYPHCD